MKYKILKVFVLLIVILLSFSSYAVANSSWHWVTVSPARILPFAIILTLLIETVSVIKWGKVSKMKKVFLIVCFANLLSFLTPYLIRAYRFIPTSGGFFVSDAFQKGPYYMVLSGYLLLTTLVELPVMYFLLQKDTVNKRNLAISVLFSNIVTTILVAVCERIICIGRW